jgi:hypothetical protein
VQEVEGAGGLQIVVAPSSEAQEAEEHMNGAHDFKLLMVQVSMTCLTCLAKKTAEPEHVLAEMMACCGTPEMRTAVGVGKKWIHA